MISECCDQYLGNQNFLLWSFSYQIGSFLATAWSLFLISLCPKRSPEIVSLTVLSTCFRFVTLSTLSIIIFSSDVLMKKNIIPLRVKKILFWQVANYRQLLHNFRAKCAVICPEGTWSSHEGKWPHVSWKKLKSRNMWQLGCLKYHKSLSLFCFLISNRTAKKVKHLQRKVLKSKFYCQSSYCQMVTNSLVKHLKCCCIKNVEIIFKGTTVRKSGINRQGKARAG